MIGLLTSLDQRVNLGIVSTSLPLRAGHVGGVEGAVDHADFGVVSEAAQEEIRHRPWVGEYEDVGEGTGWGCLMRWSILRRHGGRIGDGEWRPREGNAVATSFLYVCAVEKGKYRLHWIT